MAELNDDHIDYIIRDLQYRGLIQDGLREELVDHICSIVEEEMKSGKRFIDAYHDALVSFGHTAGIRSVQQQVIQSRTKTRGMFRSYLLVAFRNHLKNKFFTAINVMGLAVGIAACLTIMLYVVHELSYDRHFANADRIYRLNTELRVGSVYHNLALSANSLADHFPALYPEIESATRVLNWGYRRVRPTDRAEAVADNVVWADSSFFTVFGISAVEGNALTALREPNSIAISQKMADKYFPAGNALNQSLILDDNLNYKVTAVYPNFPDNTHFHFDMIRSLTGTPMIKNESLVGGGEMQLYLLLRKDANPDKLEAKFPEFVDHNLAPQLAAVLQNDFSMDKFRSEGNIWRYFLTPLTDIHLHSDLEAELEANGNVTYVYMFGSIAVFILLIACINFMNLSTARSADRAREVGIRKVMGSLRAHLIRQFLTESFLLSAAAFILAVGLAWTFLPLFNSLALKHLSVPFDTGAFYLALLAAAIFVSVMAGLYPSFFLSRYKPVHVLKGKLDVEGSSGWVRSGLVVFQFVVSIFLIVGTIAIERQLSYIQNKRVGFNKDQVLVVHDASHLGANAEVFKREVLRNNLFTAGTISAYLPVKGTWRNSNTFWPEGKAPTGKDVANMASLQIWLTDYDYLKTLGMNLKAGRNFSPEFPIDSSASVILNEVAVQQLELGPEPLGKKISAFDGKNPDGTPDTKKIRSWTVVGVVEDFHFASMRVRIAPVGLYLGRSDAYISFRFEGSHAQKAIQVVGDTWNKLATGHSFNYSFLDEDFGKMYESEKRLSMIFAIFAGLAIMIACLGLFALTSFMARQRIKEIGIRKALGASMESIVFLLSKSYARLVLLAFALSIPLSWYAVSRWLEGYSYKADVGWFVYAMAGLGALIIAMLTIGFQSIRAASTNPVNALRND